MRRTTPVIPTLFALLIFGAAAPVLLADERCSLGSIAGDWGYTITGTRLPLGPAASVGIVHFDRQGNVSGTQTLSINGTIVQGEVLTGTISVSPDCTGTSTIAVTNTPFPRTSTFYVVWVGSSSEFRAISTNDGTILTGDGKKINRGND